MALVVKNTGSGGWTVRVERQMSCAELNRIVGYRLGFTVDFDQQITKDSTLVTFHDETHAWEFARWVS